MQGEQRIDYQKYIFQIDLFTGHHCIPLIKSQGKESMGNYNIELFFYQPEKVEHPFITEKENTIQIFQYF